MGTDNLQALPGYPSTHARKTLSPSQLAIVNQKISASLLQTIALPPAKRDTPASRKFVATYAKDAALQTLHGVIWDASPLSKDDKIIRQRTLLLAEKLASSPSGLEIQDLLDLSIVYAATNLSRMKSVFAAVLKSDPSIVATIKNDLVPAFTQLLSPVQGLYAVRKASHCITSFLNSSPPEFIRCFAHSRPFILALASLYDQGLATVAASYGGAPALQSAQSRQADDWEVIWVQTKVSLVDTFHLIIRTLLNDLNSASGQALAVESERTFDIIFALLDLPSSSNDNASPSTPYLDRSLLSDYQESYSLSKTLASALRHAAEKDARLDLLESTLQSLNGSSESSSNKSKNPGVLKILLGSSGISPGMDNLGNGSRVRSANSAQTSAGGKGKGKAAAPPVGPPVSQILDIGIKVTQVLDILPDHPPAYIRALLERSSYNGNPEKVIEALLEGTAPTVEELDPERTVNSGITNVTVNDDEIRAYVGERRNIFDNEVIDMATLRVGKKNEDDSILRDRTFMEQMKADILRRAEEISDDEGEGEDGAETKGVNLAFEDEDDMTATGRKLVVAGDGEDDDESGEDPDKDEGAPAPAPPKPQHMETILELAYIRDPKLFDRDGVTRRSKARSDLKVQTGWGDEQIEGWRIMLERSPQKDKILAKHEFAGNRNAPEVENHSAPSGSGQGRGSRGGRGGPRGRGGSDGDGGGGGRGRGRGGGRGGSDGAGNAGERAWKDKNKATRANHDRKRGHDKKMARAGAGPPT